MAQAVIGSDVSDVQVAMVDGGFHHQSGTGEEDTAESLLVDPDNLDLVPKVVVPIGFLPVSLDPPKVELVAGELDTASNPLLQLLDFTNEGLFNNTHGLEVSSVAVGAGKDFFPGTGTEGMFEITDVEPRWHLARISAEGLPSASRAVRVYEAPQGGVRPHRVDVLLLPRNTACESDVEVFELLEGGAFLDFVRIYFGSASLEPSFLESNLSFRTIYAPETATICVAGDPVRPTFSWNPDYLARRADLTLPIVNEVGVEEIVIDEFGREQARARWIYRGSDVSPPLQYGDLPPGAPQPPPLAAPPLEKGKTYRVSLNFSQPWHFGVKFRVR